MNEILTETSGSILRVTVNRPTKKNAMTSAMYNALADVFVNAGNDEAIHVVIWDAAGDSFSAGNDVEDFLKNPPGPGESPQARLGNALINLDKPVIAAVQGAAIGGGTTLLTHCDFVYAGENAKFQLPFVNLGLVPEFGSSFSLPARFGYVRAAELFMLGQPFNAELAAAIGLVTRVVPDAEVAEGLRVIEDMEIEDTADLTVLPGAQALLSSLPADRWAIVTSATHRLTAARLAAAGLPVPERLISGDMVERGKPDPEPYRRGAELLGLSPRECIVLEDAPSGVGAGLAAGSRVVGVMTTHSAEDLRRATWIAQSLEQVQARVSGDGLEIQIFTAR